MGKPGRPGPTLDDYLYWQERLENRVASGLSIDEFCVAEAVSRSTFYRWAHRCDAPPQVKHSPVNSSLSAACPIVRVPTEPARCSSPKVPSPNSKCRKVVGDGKRPFHPYLALLVS